MTEKLLGSIEAGGTKFVLAVADFDFNIQATQTHPTTTPEETMIEVVRFFRRYPVEAIGIGSFGPIDVDKKSKNYGHILKTPKLAWQNFDFVGYLKKYLDVPMYYTTDVNSSAYGEYVKGSAVDANSVVYFTLGTGVGGGVIQEGIFIGGMSHAEMGHATVKRHPKDNYGGSCPFHGCECFEGLVAGPTLEGRTGIRGESLPRTHEAFEYIRYYAGQIAYNTFVNMAPERIIFGGSVLDESDMPSVRKYFEVFNNGYVATPNLEKLIVRPGISDNGSATIGNFALALKELKK